LQTASKGSPKSSGNVVPLPSCDDGLAENLIDDLQDAPGRFAIAFHLQRPEYGPDILCFQLAMGVVPINGEMQLRGRYMAFPEALQRMPPCVWRAIRGQLLKAVPFGKSSGF